MIYDTRQEGSEWVDRWIVERRDYDRLRETYREDAVAYLENLYPPGVSIRQKDGMAVCPPDPDLNRITTAIVSNLQNEKYPALKDAFMKSKELRFQLGKDNHCIVRTAMDIKTNEINYYSEDIPGPNQVQPVQEPVQQPTTQPVQQPKEPTAEPVEVFPLTMAQLGRIIYPNSGKYSSKYDFGRLSIPVPSTTPSLNRALKAYRIHHLNAIARALILRKFGKNIKTEDVSSAARKSFHRFTNTKPYFDVIKANMGTEGCRAAEEDIKAYYANFLDGVCTLKSKKFSDVYEKPWDIRHYTIHLVENMHVKLKALPKAKS